jgi:O-antigen/teichoic acid export membrane protein
MLRSDFAQKLLNNSLAHGLNFGSRWLLNLVVARQLLATDFGVFSYVYMLANLFFPTIAFGVSFYLIHYSARQQHISLLLNSLVLSFMVFLLLCLGVVAIDYWINDTVPYYLYLLSLLIGLVWAVSQAIFCYLKGRQQFFVEVKSQFVGALSLLVVVGLLFGTVITELDAMLEAVLVASLLPVVMGLNVLWPELKAGVGPYMRNFSHYFGWQDIRQRLHFALHDVFAIIMSNIPFIFLALFSSLLALGQFRKLFILFMPITLLPVIFSQVFLSRLSRLTDLGAKLQFFRKVFLFTLPLLSLPYVLMWPVGDWLYQLSFNEALDPEHLLMLHLVLATLWITLLKTYFEVLLTSLGANHYKAMLVTFAVVFTALAYCWFNYELTVELTAWLFLAGNLLITLMLVTACVWQIRLQQKGPTQSKAG